MKVTNKIRAKVCRMANNLVKEGYSKAVGDGSQPLGTAPSRCICQSLDNG